MIAEATCMRLGVTADRKKPARMQAHRDTVRSSLPGSEDYKRPARKTGMSSGIPPHPPFGHPLPVGAREGKGQGPSQVRRLTHSSPSPLWGEGRGDGPREAHTCRPHNRKNQRSIAAQAAGGGKARDSAPSAPSAPRNLSTLSSHMVCIDGAEFGSAPRLRRAAPRLRRDLVFGVPVMPVFRIDPIGRRCGSLGYVCLESLTDDRAVVIGRRFIASFGHGNRDDPETSLAQEFDIDPDRS